MTKYKETIAVDFDGVLSSYIMPFSLIPRDPPIDGAIPWLKSLIASEFNVAILSTRNMEKEGPTAIRVWLIDNGLAEDEADKLEFWSSKGKAKIYIDDRGYCFTGDNFPDLDFIRNFQPHNKETRNSMTTLVVSMEALMESGLSIKDIIKLLPKEMTKS